MSLVALPNTFRFAVFNQTGSSISDAPVGLPTVVGQLVRFDTAGSAVFGSLGVSFFGPGGAASLANNGYLTGPTFSNASGWLGGDFQFSAFASGNASGPLSLFLEASPDSGTTWPVAASANGPGGGLIVAAIGFASTTTASTASTTRIVNFAL